MPHINELIDYVIGVFIVEDDKVLLIDHKKLNCWLPPGGHIELYEDPIEAVYRETREETGLEIELIGKAPVFDCPRTKSFIPPRFFNIHPITETHRHVGMNWLARRKSGEVTLAPDEHNGIGWFSAWQLSTMKMWPSTRHYAEVALIELASDPIQIGRWVQVVGQGCNREVEYQFFRGKVIYIDGEDAVVEFGSCCQVFRKKALKLEEKQCGLSSTSQGDLYRR